MQDGVINIITAIITAIVFFDDYSKMLLYLFAKIVI